jgi:uncharacterized membrane-anchored protein YitT (DUF2179 family)
MMTRKKKFSELRDYIVLALAMLVGSIGWVVFLLPNHITLGGLPRYFVHPLLGVRHTGSGHLSGAQRGAAGVCAAHSRTQILHQDHLCRARVHGLRLRAANAHGWFASAPRPTVHGHRGGRLFFLGGSVGMGLSCNGSTGGSDVIAAMINKYHDISLGHAILMCDVCVVTSSYFVLGDWEKVIYGYVVLFVSSICVDRVVNMMRRSVQFFIISDKHEEIGHAINLDMMRGCTIINGQGFYSGKEVKMLFVLARQSESSKIFRLIDEIDPTAFVSQSAVIGVYGLGFDRFKGKK